ncbi:MAG: HD domain-containing protein [Acholeplasmatales bacterium]|jgi:3'-5' exoribonuclease|nr:HD domain-containing protein [Acholeplasmatales bacterium]
MSETKVIAKYLALNKNKEGEILNILVKDISNMDFSIWLTEEQSLKLIKGKVYEFTYEILTKNRGDIPYEYKKFVNAKTVEQLYKIEKVEEILKHFFDFVVPIAEIKKSIEGYMKCITNKNLLAITKKIYKKFESRFYLHPAATKVHHAYIGGLCYHTNSMLRMASSYCNEYPYLDKSLLYAGVILHDIIKIEEIDSENDEYTISGNLIGHLIGGAIEIDRAAKELKLENSEEALVLKHMIISHHGQFTYGSQKKPQVAEALMLWYLDSIDAKFRVLGEVLDKTEAGTYTISVAVLEKSSFYKTRFSSKKDKENE